MKSSDEFKELATALAKAQGAIGNPKKDLDNKFFDSKYADLATGLNAIKQALSENGIAVVQTTSMTSELIMLETRLIHTSGQWIATDYPVCKFPVRHQEGGSAMTFARRYSLFAIVGIAGEGEDDDGNAANKSQIDGSKKDNPEQAIFDTDTSKEKSDKMLLEIPDQKTLPELRSWAERMKPIKDQLQPQDSRSVAEEFGKRQKELAEEYAREKLKEGG